ncbi:hypothetical protein O181_030340 [Austropuccinia psidii MF-1]|uniref:Uncharacterized protein n=1 Tax=Austropuccinia psidii MF-1 TaxID=1389203 RepID=A0A9Q3CX25_9BASI|nr:hypothetical protein [Austropuccinia psidii MF-1]
MKGAEGMTLRSDRQYSSEKAFWLANCNASLGVALKHLTNQSTSITDGALDHSAICPYKIELKTIEQIYLKILLANLVKLDIPVFGSHDRSLKIWDRETGKCIHTIVGHRAAVTSVKLTDDKVISGSDDGEIRICWFTSNK